MNFSLIYSKFYTTEVCVQYKSKFFIHFTKLLNFSCQIFQILKKSVSTYLGTTSKVNRTLAFEVRKQTDLFGNVKIKSAWGLNTIKTCLIDSNQTDKGINMILYIHKLLILDKHLTNVTLELQKYSCRV